MSVTKGMKSLQRAQAAFKKKMKSLTKKLDQRAARRSPKARDTRRARNSISKSMRRARWRNQRDDRSPVFQSPGTRQPPRKLEAFTISYAGETLERYKAVREAKISRDHARKSGRPHGEYYWAKDVDGSDAEYSRFWGMVAYKVQEDPRPKFRNAPCPYDPLNVEHPYWQFQIENPEY